jgi:hypothetical protein
MKAIKVLFKIGLLLIAILVMTSIYHDRSMRQEMRCRMVHYDYNSEINAAIESEGINKVAHLQAAQILLQILYQKECCEYEETCPAGLKL